MRNKDSKRPAILRCQLCGFEHTEVYSRQTQWSLLHDMGPTIYSFGVLPDCFLHQCDDGRLGKYELVGFGREQ